MRHADDSERQLLQMRQLRQHVWLQLARSQSVKKKFKKGVLRKPGRPFCFSSSGLRKLMLREGEHRFCRGTHEGKKEGAPRAPYIALPPELRLQRGETGPPRDKRQPPYAVARMMPCIENFNGMTKPLYKMDLQIPETAGARKIRDRIQFLKTISRK